MRTLCKVLMMCIGFNDDIEAQTNLVCNGSFENINGCPFSEIINNGYLPCVSNPANHTPDYFNPCFLSTNPYVSVPSNIRGYQQARTGIAYVGIDLWEKNFTAREYVQIKLADSLKMAHHYSLECFLSKAEGARYGISDFGIYFLNDYTSMQGTDVLPFIPQIINPSGNYLIDTALWIPVTGTYLAQGGECYIILGNFKPSGTSPDTVYQYYGSGNYADAAYYYIDDVSLIDLDSALSIEKSQATLYSLQVYPNPAQEQVTVTNSNTYKELLVEDMQSRLLNRHSFGSGNLTLDVSNLPAGMYMLRASGSKGTARRRLIVEH